MVITTIIGPMSEVTGASCTTIALSYDVTCAMALAAPRSPTIAAKSGVICAISEEIAANGAMTATDIVLGGAGKS